MHFPENDIAPILPVAANLNFAQHSAVIHFPAKFFQDET
jgi:hypothetical protein